MTAPVPAAAPATALAGAAERLRQAARWLVVTFGAVAGVVFAGIGISSFGSLDADTEHTQFVAALVGAGAAMVGTLVALLTATALAAASAVGLEDLVMSVPGSSSLGRAQAAVKASPLLAPWNGKPADFVESVRQAASGYRDKLQEWRDDPAQDAKSVNRAAKYHDYLSGTERAVLQTASYVRLHTRFRRAGWILAPALLVATAGGVLFVWATGAPATEHVPTKATIAEWRVPVDQRAEVAARLGATCAYEPTAVPVVIIGSQGTEYEVVTDPAEGCAPLRLTVAGADVARTP